MTEREYSRVFWGLSVSSEDTLPLEVMILVAAKSFHFINRGGGNSFYNNRNNKLSCIFIDVYRMKKLIMYLIILQLEKTRKMNLLVF